MSEDKTLIIYSGHEINDNLLFFCRNGYIDDPRYDFVFTLNNPNLKLEFSVNRPNIKIITRPNIGIDFGGWTDTLFMKDGDTDKYLYEKYKYFILLNSTVRGPFLPLWYDQEQHEYWPELFVSKLDDSVKLVGAAVAFYLIKPFISSAFLVMDQTGLKIGRENGIFDLKTINMTKRDVVIKKEIKFTSCIIAGGYNVKCMLQYYKNIDLSKYIPTSPSGCHLSPNKYFGINVNPYEVVFIKQNRNIEPNIMSKYTEWLLNRKDNIVIVKYGTSENESIDVTNKIKEYIRKNMYIIRTNFNINTILSDPNNTNKFKKLFLYSKTNNEVLLKTIDVVGGLLTSNVIFI